jgi:hypothetical protein
MRLPVLQKMKGIMEALTALKPVTLPMILLIIFL